LKPLHAKTGDRASGGAVQNMDRKKAALGAMRIEQRQLLMAMPDIAAEAKASIGRLLQRMAPAFGP